jgi:chemotaxis protein methyltransferase WspC
MALLDVGLPPDRFRVQALDVSRRAIAASRDAVYGARSVRRAGPERLRRFFDEDGDQWRVRDEVRQLVRFSRGNLVDAGLLVHAPPFDVVFCRNALIYLSDEARRQALATLSRLVRTDGVLVTGHAESLRLVEPAFVSARVPRTFAWVPSTPGAGTAGPVETGAHARGRPTRLARKPTAASRTGAAALDDRPGGSRPAGAGARPDPPAAPAGGPATLLAQATRLADTGDLVQASAVAARLVQTWPGEARGHYLAGVIASGLGRHADAEAALRRAVYLAPGDEQALLHLAFLRARHGDAAEAARLRRRATLARTGSGGDRT